MSRLILLLIIIILAVGTNEVVAAWHHARDFGTKAMGVNAAEDQGNVRTVMDGDTLILKDGTHVRLLGIDSPEYPLECGSFFARHVLTSLTQGQDVRVEMEDAPYALVYVNDTLLNLDMIRRGAAAAWTGAGLGETDPLWPEFNLTMDDAKRAKRGIWGRCPGAHMHADGVFTGKRR